MKSQAAAGDRGSAATPARGSTEPPTSLEQLAQRYELSARQSGQLSELLALLERDPYAPSAVRAGQGALDNHIADSLVALELEAVRRARVIADLGSGAGFPGLPLAIALPRSKVFLIESGARKCEYLERALAASGARNASAVCSRVEQWRDGTGAVDVVVARALAARAVVLEYAAPLLRRDGVLVDWRGRRGAPEEHRAAQAAAQLGLRPLEVREVAPFAAARDRHLHLYLKVSETPAAFPRRAGAAAKRPLA